MGKKAAHKRSRKKAAKKVGAKHRGWPHRANGAPIRQLPDWTLYLLNNLMDEGYSRRDARELVNLAKS